MYVLKMLRLHNIIALILYVKYKIILLMHAKIKLSEILLGFHRIYGLEISYYYPGHKYNKMV